MVVVPKVDRWWGGSMISGDWRDSKRQRTEYCMMYHVWRLTPKVLGIR